MIELATIGEAVAVIAACWAIISGVGAWKREFIGKRKIELAEDMLASFFELSDAVAFIRNPFASSNEGRTRQRGEHENPEHSKLLDRAYIVFERYEQKKEVFVRLNTLKYRFMAVFGSETESLFHDIGRTVNSIFASANALGTRYWPQQGRVRMDEEQFQRHLDAMQRHEGIFWDTYGEDDEIRQRLAEYSTRLERITAPCFEEPLKSYKIITQKLPFLCNKKRQSDT
ncbi:hypothetical protein [Saccharospirillum sp.]|uniref:hypothetical protein n=1 Tax=Saccharospirillum sp. TaxID=2033801 RepID=UPI0034A0210D